jgi:hypothetical protein
MQGVESTDMFSLIKFHIRSCLRIFLGRVYQIYLQKPTTTSQVVISKPIDG